MPGNIREAPAQDLSIQPTERGVDALQQAARRVGAFYSQAADDFTGEGQRLGSAVKAAGEIAVKVEEHHEKSSGSANLFKLKASLDQQWRDLPKDPNDPTIAAKFREEVIEPALDKFANKGFLTEGGQSWAESHVSALRQHLYDKTAADMSTLAGEAVKVNAAKTVNSAASGARLDPSSLDFTLKTLDSSLGGVVDSSPNLSVADSGRVRTEVLQRAKEQIVRAAGLGIIERNPDADLGAFEKKYGEYMPPGEMQQLVQAAKAQARANLYYQKGAETYQHQQDVRQADASLSKSWTEHVSFDENGRPTINPQIFKDVMATEKRFPGVATERAKAIINWAQSQQREKREIIVTDRATQAALYDGLFSADHPTTDVDILKAAAGNKLDPHATSTLMNLHKALEERPLKGPIWHDTMDAVKSELLVSVPGLTGKDFVGISNYAKFAQTFIPQYLAKERSGTLLPNALDVKDPNSMISQAMAPFKRTMAQRMSDYMAILSATDAKNPSGQGETALGVEVKDAPPFNPPRTWQYNAKTDQFRDPATMKIYNRAGREIQTPAIPMSR